MGCVVLEETFKSEEEDLCPNKKCSFSGLNKHNSILLLCSYVADPATFLAPNSVKDLDFL